MTPHLTTPRLVLRPFVMDDAPVMARLLHDPAVARWLTVVPQPYTVGDAHDFIDSNLASRDPVYAVCTADGLIGCVSVKEQLGYWYGRPFWGQGYATEAARAVVDHFFARASDSLASGYHLGNVGSRHVLTKLGFVSTDTRVAHSRGLNRDVTIQNMVLTRRVWEATQ